MCLCKCFCLDTFSLFPMIPMILEGHQRLIGKSGRFETTNQGLVENGLSLIPVDWKWRYTLWRLTKPHDFEDVLGIGTCLSNRMWMERDAMSQSEWKDKQKKIEQLELWWDVIRGTSLYLWLPWAIGVKPDLQKLLGLSGRWFEILSIFHPWGVTIPIDSLKKSACPPQF